MTGADEIDEWRQDRGAERRFQTVQPHVAGVKVKTRYKSSVNSNYELSVVLWSMFAADGVMLHCSVKSGSMVLLEKLPMKAEGAPNRKQNGAVQNKRCKQKMEKRVYMQQ